MSAKIAIEETNETGDMYTLKKETRQTLFRMGSVVKQFEAIKLNLVIDIITLIPIVAVALMANSVMLIADILEITKGILSNIISFYILRRKANQTVADDEMGKIEALGSFVSITIILIGLLCTAIVSIFRLFEPIALQTNYTWLGMMIQLAGLALNGWLWKRNAKAAKLLYSPQIEALWRTNRADFLSNIAVLVALILSTSLHEFYWSVYIDPVCALLFISYASCAFVPLLQTNLKNLLVENNR